MYAVVYESNKTARPPVEELQRTLEKGKDEDKRWAMRNILRAMYNGDALPQLLMPVIRFVMPSRDKPLKKLLHLYWEVVPKLGPDGKLKQEMILACNAIRNDLQHPNEYIRGGTLRFLAKLREQELLEPLIPSVRSCLEHRHAYVRKNAVLCVKAIAQTSDLIPDASDLVAALLESETDSTVRRNAFVTLAALDRDAAYGYFSEQISQINSLDELLQLSFIEFLRTDAASHPELLPQYTQIVQTIDASNPVAYDAAAALAALSSQPTDLAHAAKTFVRIAVQESDNNAKVIALNRVAALQARAPGALNGLIMDVLLVLGTPDVDVRKQALDLAMLLVSSRTVANVVRILKKELAASVAQDYDKNAEYRRALIAAIHHCAVRFDEVTASVVAVLLDFIGDFNRDSAVEVVEFIKEVVQLFPKLRKEVISQLLTALPNVRSASVFRGVLWVIGEYCESREDIHDSWLGLRQSIGPLPLSREIVKSETEEGDAPKESKKPKVLADGTYATESAFYQAEPEKLPIDSHPLRHLLLEKENFLAASLAVALTKLVLRAPLAGVSEPQVNGMRAEALLLFTSLLRLGKMDEDSFDRIYSCVQVLLSGDDKVRQDFLERPHDAFVSLLKANKAKEDAASRSLKEKNATSVDTPIRFRWFDHLNPEVYVTEKPKLLSANAIEDKISSQLKQVYQLTGYSDPIYAEAHMKVHQFDIVLDVMLFNQTTETLQKLSVEFFTVGDLKVVDRPTIQNVPPMSFYTTQTTIRVNSADSGVICGNITYEGKTAIEGAVIILNEIPLNVLDYIKPAKCTDSEFRDMWSKFEWENKVAISSTQPSLSDYVKQLMKHTNMGCLTEGVLDSEGEQCQFLSANLYARTSFGEDALANLSIELTGGRVVGHLRIRSKTQGPALSIGDRASEMERKTSA